MNCRSFYFNENLKTLIDIENHWA